MSQTVRTSVTIPKQDQKRLEQIAEKKKVSVAWVVREAIEKYLEREAPRK